MNLLKTAAAAAMVLAATAAPLTIDPAALAQGESLVRISSACGQAESPCTAAHLKICSTHDKDIRDAACSEGCGAVPSQPIAVATVES